MKWCLSLLVVACLCGCSFGPNRPVLPADNSVVRDQLVVYSDFHLPQRHRLLDDLAMLRGDVAGKLQLPTSDEPIHVYLFESNDEYHEFMDERFPEFPERRAFFVENDTNLRVFAHWGERIAEDLRHEVAHGY